MESLEKKVALVSTNLGCVFRGVERFTAELFQLIKDEIPATLFKGGGSRRPRENVIPYLRRNGILYALRNLPWNHFYFSQLSYALSFLPFQIFGQYAVIHFCEPSFGKLVGIFSKWLGLKPILLYTHSYHFGLEEFCKGMHYIQVLNPWNRHRLLEIGYPPNRVIELPCGIYTKRFVMPGQKETLREKYDIPKNCIVILCVAALDRGHKRVNYVAREISKLGKDFFCLAVGHPEDPSVIEEARSFLGDRFRTLTIPFEDMPEIYNVADIFVSGSVSEAFGLSVVEAMCARLPVVAHDSPHFEWLIGDRECLVDIRHEDHLTRKIREVIDHYQDFEKITDENYERVVSRFDWSVLKPKYLEMYQKVMEG